MSHYPGLRPYSTFGDYIPFKVSLNRYTRSGGNQLSECMPLFVWLWQAIRAALKPSRPLNKYIKIIKTLPCNDMGPNHWSQVPLIYLFSSTLMPNCFNTTTQRYYSEYSQNTQIQFWVHVYVYYGQFQSRHFMRYKHECVPKLRNITNYLHRWNNLQSSSTLGITRIHREISSDYSVRQVHSFV